MSLIDEELTREAKDYALNQLGADLSGVARVDRFTEDPGVWADSFYQFTRFDHP